MVARVAFYAFLAAVAALGGYQASRSTPRCRWTPAHANTLTERVNGEWKCQ